MSYTNACTVLRVLGRHILCTVGTKHALTVQVGLATVLVTREVYMALFVLSTLVYAVICLKRNPYRTNGAKHALTVSVGLPIALVTRKACMVLVALVMLARLKDKQGYFFKIVWMRVSKGHPKHLMTPSNNTDYRDYCLRDVLYVFLDMRFF